MELSRLSARQKRIQEWSRHLSDNHYWNESLKVRFVDTLKDYRNLLAKFWESGVFGKSEDSQLADLERQLEQLFNESRLRS